MKWNIGWGCVSACNMRCAFCYSKNKRLISKDLGFTQWKRFVDQNAELIANINYGTGENSLSDDWFKLIQYIRDQYPHIRQALTTNGHIYEAVSNNSEKKQIFLSAIDEVDVSLDYADRDKHNEFRGQPKAYDWALKTLELCYANSIPVTIVTLGSDLTLFKANVEGIFKIANRYNAVVRINIYRPTNGIDDQSKQFILQTENLLKFLEYIHEHHRTLSVSDALLSPIFTGTASKDPSGKNSLRILPNGNITPSTYLISDDFVLGNIKDDISLATLDLNEVLIEKMRNVIPEQCTGCSYIEMCEGGVLDRRYLWNGSLDKKDPYCFIDDEELVSKYNFKLPVDNENFTSVHDGYLPTMFFKCKEKK